MKLVAECIIHRYEQVETMYDICAELHRVFRRTQVFSLIWKATSVFRAYIETFVRVEIMWTDRQ